MSSTTNELSLRHNLSYCNPDLTSDVVQNLVHYPLIFYFDSVVIVISKLAVFLCWPWGRQCLSLPTVSYLQCYIVVREV